MGAGPSGPVFIRDPDHVKLQLEELHATEANGLSDLVEGELQKVEWCDLMTWQFPLWWFGLPAALKGWVDRVFAMGRTYGGGHYTTAEPCPMCLAAILWSRIGTVVFGSSIRFLQQQGWRQIDILAEEVVRRSPGWACTIIGGVLEQECNALFEGRAG